MATPSFILLIPAIHFITASVNTSQAVMSARSAMIIVQRDEGLLLTHNVTYHLALGMSQIVIVDNASQDIATIRILRALSQTPRVTVLYDTSELCDQSRLANGALSLLLQDDEIEWIFPCDADEFIWLSEDLSKFLARCRASNRLYCTIPWLNHIPEARSSESDPCAYLRGSLFYVPFPERHWQHTSNFRKAFCFRHSGMEIVVGGHFFRREANPGFFANLMGCPFELPEQAASIFHYEMRDCGTALLTKWRNLAERHRASGIALNGPWREKEERLGYLWRHYNRMEEVVFEHFAQAGRTLWGTPVPRDQLRRKTIFTESLLSWTGLSAR